jgi:hypothetical protein
VYCSLLMFRHIDRSFEFVLGISETLLYSASAPEVTIVLLGALLLIMLLLVTLAYSIRGVFP